MPTTYDGNAANVTAHEAVQIQVPQTLDAFDAAAFNEALTRLADVAAFLQQHGALRGAVEKALFQGVSDAGGCVAYGAASNSVAYKLIDEVPCYGAGIYYRRYADGYGAVFRITETINARRSGGVWVKDDAAQIALMVSKSIGGYVAVSRWAVGDSTFRARAQVTAGPVCWGWGDMSVGGTFTHLVRVDVGSILQSVEKVQQYRVRFAFVPGTFSSADDYSFSATPVGLSGVRVSVYEKTAAYCDIISYDVSEPPVPTTGAWHFDWRIFRQDL